MILCIKRQFKIQIQKFFIVTCAVVSCMFLFGYVEKRKIRTKQRKNVDHIVKYVTPSLSFLAYNIQKVRKPVILFGSSRKLRTYPSVQYLAQVASNELGNFYGALRKLVITVNYIIYFHRFVLYVQTAMSAVGVSFSSQVSMNFILLSTNSPFRKRKNCSCISSLFLFQFYFQ